MEKFRVGSKVKVIIFKESSGSKKYLGKIGKILFIGEVCFGKFKNNKYALLDIDNERGGIYLDELKLIK